jgi:glutamyl-tRNA synthetase
MKTKTDAELAQIYQSILKSKGVNASNNFVEKVVSQIKERATFVSDFWEQSSYFFVAPESYDEKAAQKFWKEETPKLVNDCLEILKNVEPFTSQGAEEEIKKYIEKNELGFGKIANPLRLAIVGAGKGPHLFDIMEMIGKQETVNRLEIALKKL